MAGYIEHKLNRSRRGSGQIAYPKLVDSDYTRGVSPRLGLVAFQNLSAITSTHITFKAPYPFGIAKSP